MQLSARKSNVWRAKQSPRNECVEYCVFGVCHVLLGCGMRGGLCGDKECDGAAAAFVERLKKNVCVAQC